MTKQSPWRNTTLEEAGYLSGQADRMRNTIVMQYVELIARCRAASRIAMAIRHDFGDDPAHLRVAAASWDRSITACQASVLLAERGMVSEACAILRTGFEHLFFAGALLKEPAVLDRMRDQDLSERKKTVRLALADPQLGRVATPQQRAQLEAILQQPSGPLRISAFDAAQIAGLSAVFQTAYRQLSMIGTHSTFTSVGASFGQSDRQLPFEQSLDDLPQLLSLIEGCLQIGSEAFRAAQAPDTRTAAGQAGSD